MEPRTEPGTQWGLAVFCQRRQEMWPVHNVIVTWPLSGSKFLYHFPFSPRFLSFLHCLPFLPLLFLFSGFPHLLSNLLAAFMILPLSPRLHKARYPMTWQDCLHWPHLCTQCLSSKSVLELCCCCCSVAKPCPALCDPMDYGTPGLLCPPLSPGVCSNSHPLSQWCSLTISSSTTLFSICLQSFSASGSFPMSQLFASGGQSIRASASVLLMNIEGLFPFRK